MNFDMHGPEQLQQNVREFLRASDHYRAAYRAAFAYDARPVLPQLEVPVLITAARADPLAGHLSRAGERATCVQITTADEFSDTLNRSLQHLLNYPGDPGPATVAPAPIDDRFWNDFINTPAAGLRLRRRGGTGDRTSVVLHGAGGSSETCAHILRAVASAGAVIAVDLPGHGESEQTAAADAGIDRWVDAVLEVLDRLNLKQVTLAGEQAGAVVALAACRRAPERIAALILLDLPLLTDAQRSAYRAHALPSLAPEWHGGHLLQAWHMARDSRLFFPWFERTRRGIRWIEADLDNDAIHREARELLSADGAWQQLLQDQLDYPIAEELSAVTVPMRLCATPDSPFRPALDDAAASLGTATASFVSLPDDRARWASALFTDA